MTEYAALENPVLKKPVSFERFIYVISMIISGFSTAYLLSVFITGNTWLSFTEIEADSSELILSIIQCLLGVAALHIPKLITKLTHINFPDTLCVFFYIFIICGTVLGEMFSLYYAVPIWDSLLHFDSGLMSGMLGGILLVSFLENKKCSRIISPMFIAIAAVCFALCIGVIWEIYEFTVDSLLGLNMQKCLLQDGSELIGQAALADTMQDLIVDFAGAVVAAISSFISLRHRTGWLYTYLNDEIKAA